MFIDFGTPKLLAKHVNYNTKSTFSSFQKVIILANFWPPKMTPKSQKRVILGLQKANKKNDLSEAFFLKNVVLRQREHHFWGFTCSYFFMKIVCFFVFKKTCFFGGPGPHFFDFGRFWGPPKSTLTPQKRASRCSESTIFQKICFFIKKSLFLKNIIFHPFRTPKKHPKSSKNHRVPLPRDLLFFS